MENTEPTEPTTTALTPNEAQTISLFKSFVEDTLKFRTKGTASAAAKARKSASALAKLLKVVRKELQEDKASQAAARKEASDPE